MNKKIENSEILLYKKVETELKRMLQCGILKKGGHCPCRKLADDTTLCPCDEFVSTGVCKCNLFIKKETAVNLENKKKD